MSTTITDLAKMLRLGPVMGQFHPLVPICLSETVEIIASPERLIEELDAPVPHHERAILITQFEPKFSHRFQTLNHPSCPPAEPINQNLPHQVDKARTWLLTNHGVADRIVADTRKKHYEAVILLLVDGLSYADVLDWPELPEPCFIDGPSITFSRTPDGKIDPQVGFPAIVGIPSLARRLMDVGLPRSRGYSYWQRSRNDVSERLFEGVPLEKVAELEVSFDAIKRLDLKGFFVQLVREGLDGLAHSRREVSIGEIQATIKAIRDDFRYLIDLLVEKQIRGAVYLVADHGILWKNQHHWQVIDSNDAKRPRYATSSPNKPDFTTRFHSDQQRFYLWRYPYLGRPIRANDSGVHGGLSYWESIVPFIQVEVNV